MRIFRFLFITNLILFLSTTNLFSQSIYIPDSYKSLQKTVVHPELGIKVTSRGIISSNKFLAINAKSCSDIFAIDESESEDPSMTKHQFSADSDNFYTRLNNSTEEMVFPTYTSLVDGISIVKAASHSNLHGLSIVDVVYIPKTTQYVEKPNVKANNTDPSQTKYKASTFTLSGFFYVLEGLNNKEKYSSFQEFCKEYQIPYIRGHRDGSYPLKPSMGYTSVKYIPHDRVVTLTDLYPDTPIKYLGSLADLRRKKNYNFTLMHEEEPTEFEVFLESIREDNPGCNVEDYSEFDISVYGIVDEDELNYEQGDITRYLIPVNADSQKIEILLDKLNVSRFNTPISNTSSRIIIEYK